jgi:hypothetical protein
MVVVLAPPLLAYVAVPGFFRGCAGSEGGSHHLAALRSASHSQQQSPCHPVIMVVVLGTLFSSWRVFAGAGYLSRGGKVVSDWEWQVRTRMFSHPFPSPLMAVGVGGLLQLSLHPFPGERGGGGVVEGSG